MEEYLAEQTDDDRAKIEAAIQALGNEYPQARSVSVKMIKASIREIRVTTPPRNQHRIAFVAKGGTIHLLHAWRKKTEAIDKRTHKLIEKRAKAIP